ncbi:leucine-rich repeat-containing protein 38 [Mesoplodon densirostris]|uniref:leucine-rich repeat-containing protein 38 n=1 Tax=Mesoplodon densirostris TaxID=48708 RepID=UPI0028DC1CBF|nr:leucine-rich repeat-containing protein 38 [Mesoplodon densirostris]
MSAGLKQHHQALRPVWARPSPPPPSLPSNLAPSFPSDSPHTSLSPVAAGCVPVQRRPWGRWGTFAGGRVLDGLSAGGGKEEGRPATQELPGAPPTPGSTAPGAVPESPPGMPWRRARGTQVALPFPSGSPRLASGTPRARAQALSAPAALRLPAPVLRDPARRPAPGLGPGAASASPPLAWVPAMSPRAAPRAPAGAAAALGLCSLLLLLPPGAACPAGCACTDPHTVDCRDRGLPSVPDPFPLDVRKLLVAGNRIQHIPEGFFIFYGDLVYLDFRNNSLRSLEEGTFSGSAKLAFLDLSYNNLTQLGAGAFRSAERLVKLSLANNNLAGVHEAAFETLESLQVLELNDNNLRSLNVAALAALPALRTLRLDGNPWLCDCDFAHLFSWIQENVSKLPKGLDEIQCSLPVENRRIFLQELSEASFSECKFSLSLTDLFIIIFSGVAVSIAAIISSFFLATVVQCFQRCAPNKDAEDEEEDEDD